MPTIRKRKDTGIYFLDVRIDGRRHRVDLDTRDRSVAKMRAKLKLRELGQRIPTDRKRFTDFEREYFEWAESIKKPRTVGTERNALKRFLEFRTVVFLDQVDVKHCDEFTASVARETSPAYVNQLIRSLRSVFSAALKWGYVAFNPFARVKQLRWEKRPVRVLTVPELQKIFRQARRLHPEYASLYEFYLLTGLRRNEALGLEWEDVDFEHRILTVRNTKGKRFRHVPLMRRAIVILRDRRHLTRPFGLRDDRATKNYKEAARAAGIENTSLHDLRRAFISYMVKAGYPAAFVQQWAGHSDFKVTSEYYLGTPEELWEKIADSGPADFDVLKN